MKTLKVTVENKMAVISIDQPDSHVNVINHSLLAEFESTLETIEEDDSITSLILVSAKKNHFIAGADLKLIRDFKKPGEALDFSRRLTQLLNRLKALRPPVIAAVNGPALGGGLEFVLACDYRIATDHPATKFGFPEVTLGLCPAAGGTQRLPELIGLTEALPLLLTGNPIRPHEAKAIGLVDELIHEHDMMQSAQQAAEDLAQTAGDSKEAHRHKKLSRKNASNRPGMQRTRTTRLMETNPLGQRWIFSQVEKNIRIQTRGLYPAPFAILTCIKHGLTHGMEKGLALESETFEELVHTPEARQLIFGYFARQSAKKNPSRAKPREVNHIGVLGAGLMGSGITSISVRNGFEVTLKDRDYPSAIPGKQTTWQDLEEKVARNILSDFDRNRLLRRIHLTDDYRDLKDLPLVLEAVFEEVSVKHAVLKEAESVISEEAVFATNTSAIPIADIAKAARRPERVIGMHYFSPAQKMPLVEIIKGEKTEQKAVATACDVGIRQGKYVIVVGDAPGFYVTRIIIPMINEAMHLIEEGADIRIIDTAMKNFGFPVGPLTLVDEAGFDVTSRVNETMAGVFKKRGVRIPQVLFRLYDAGYAGRKNKRGFYDYRDKKKLINEEVYSFFGGTDRKDFSLDEIMERISLLLINEALHCLQEEIIRDPKDGDIGAVLGMGFPAFLGGPFRYIDQKGLKQTLDKMEYQRNLNGERFKPAQLLVDHLKANKPFYT